MIIGNFIEPKIFGKSLEIHPIVVLVALVQQTPLSAVVYGQSYFDALALCAD